MGKNARELESETKAQKAPAMSMPERKNTVDLLSLTLIRQYMSPRIQKLVFDGRPAVAKFARWPWPDHE